MRKLLKPKDILMLGLAGVGDMFEEIKDPLNLASSAYENMYGFIPNKYKRHNFSQVVERSLKTKDIDIIFKDGKKYLCLTPQGNEKTKRNFPILNLIKDWNKKWVLVIFDIEEKKRKIRDRLRLKLKTLGFGMLQKSIWLTPLPIGEEFLDYIELNNLPDVFVLEIASMLLGDPKILARKIWNLDKLVEISDDIKMKMGESSSLIASLHDRIKMREAKSSETNLKKKIEKAKKTQREVNRARLEFISSLPPLPLELFPEEIKYLF